METNGDLGIFSACWPVNKSCEWPMGKGPKTVFNTSLEPSWMEGPIVPCHWRKGNPSPRTANILPVYTTYLAAADQRGFQSHKRLLIDWARAPGTKRNPRKAQVKRFFVKQIVAGIVKGFYTELWQKLDILFSTVRGFVKGLAVAAKKGGNRPAECGQECVSYIFIKSSYQYVNIKKKHFSS